MSDWIEVISEYVMLHHNMMFGVLVWNLMLTFGVLVALFKKPEDKR